jgi:hypothetical protein
MAARSERRCWRERGADHKDAPDCGEAQVLGELSSLISVPGGDSYQVAGDEGDEAKVGPQFDY